MILKLQARLSLCFLMFFFLYNIFQIVYHLKENQISSFISFFFIISILKLEKNNLIYF
jgi:hypothetical protein